MPILSNTSGSNGGPSLFSAIEFAPTIVQHGWDDKGATPEGYQSVIETANKLIDLSEYLQTKLVLEDVPSSSAWSFKTTCPFHKGGHERTASFFINTEQNRFYCQACNISGGIVEYISKSFKRPPILVAEHIMSCVQGNYKVDDINIKKAADRKRFQVNYLKLSDLYRTFVRKYVDDDDALNYINKCFSGLDSVIEENQEKIEESIEQIVHHLEQYLAKYEEKQ